MSRDLSAISHVWGTTNASHHPIPSSIRPSSSRVENLSDDGASEIIFEFAPPTLLLARPMFSLALILIFRADALSAKSQTSRNPNARRTSWACRGEREACLISINVSLAFSSGLCTVNWSHLAPWNPNVMTNLVVRHPFRAFVAFRGHFQHDPRARPRVSTVCYPS